VLRNSKENCRIQKRLTVQNMSHTLFHTVCQYRLNPRSLTNVHCLLHKPVTTAYCLESRKGFEFLKLTVALASRNFRQMCNQPVSISCLELIIYWLQLLYCRTDGDRRHFCTAGLTETGYSCHIAGLMETGYSSYTARLTQNGYSCYIGGLTETG